MISISYNCMLNMTNFIRKHNSKIMKNPAPSTTKTCNYRQKQTILWMVTAFLNTLLTKDLLQLPININMVLVKTLSKNVTITMNVLSEINLVKSILNFPSMYRNGKTETFIILLIWLLLWNLWNMFVDLESII